MPDLAVIAETTAGGLTRETKPEIRGADIDRIPVRHISFSGDISGMRHHAGSLDTGPMSQIGYVSRNQRGSTNEHREDIQDVALIYLSRDIHGTFYIS